MQQNGEARVLSVKGAEDLLRLHFDLKPSDVELLNVAFVTLLSLNLLSLYQITAAHHTNVGTENAVNLCFASGRTLLG